MYRNSVLIATDNSARDRTLNQTDCGVIPVEMVVGGGGRVLWVVVEGGVCGGGRFEGGRSGR